METQKFFDYLILKLAKYHTPFIIIITLLIMLISFSFLFKFFFLPMNNVYEIYNSGSELKNYSVIDKKLLDKVHENIDKKINREKTPAHNIEFPF